MKYFFKLHLQLSRHSLAIYLLSIFSVIAALSLSTRVNAAKKINSEQGYFNADCSASKITSVSIHPSLAEITRSVSLKVSKKSKGWFCIRSLPINLRPSSLKIKFPSNLLGNNNIVLEKVYRLVQLKQAILEKMNKLEGLLAKRLGVEQEIQLKNQTYNFLKELNYRPQVPNSSQVPLRFKAGSGRILKSLVSVNLSAGKLQELIYAKEEELVAIQDSISKLRLDLKQENSLQGQSWSYDLYFTLNAPTGTYEAEIKYIVPNVSWKPLYDVRADVNPKTSKIKLSLVTHAELNQSSKEDWVNVNAMFSSLDPMSLILPSRKRWVFEELREEVVEEQESKRFIQKSRGRSKSTFSNYLGGKQNTAALDSQSEVAPRAQSQRAKRKRIGKGAIASSAPMQESLMQDMAVYNGAGSKGGMHTNWNTNRKNSKVLFPVDSIRNIFSSYGSALRKIELESNQYASQRNIVDRRVIKSGQLKQNSSLASKSNGRNLLYQAQLPISLQHSDSPLRVPLETRPLEAKLNYMAVPHLESKVYIRALVQNTTQKPILGGNAQIFINGKLTTKTNLNSISEHGTFYVDLGVDKNIEIERVVSKKSEDEGVLFKKHKTHVDVKITIANRHSFPVEVDLGDRQPLSPHKEIEINSLSVSDQGVLRKETGMISWKIKLKARENREVNFSYNVAHPENFLVSELN